jgi:hypothetical protein
VFGVEALDRFLYLIAEHSQLVPEFSFGTANICRAQSVPTFRRNPDGGPREFRPVWRPAHGFGNSKTFQQWEAVFSVYPLVRVAFVRGQNVFALSAQQVRPDLPSR